MMTEAELAKIVQVLKDELTPVLQSHAQQCLNSYMGDTLRYTIHKEICLMVEKAVATEIKVKIQPRKPRRRAS